jgi:hypothetical protein
LTFGGVWYSIGVEVRETPQTVTTEETMNNPINTNALVQARGVRDRLNRAEVLVAEGKVHPVRGMEDHYIVQSSKGDVYLVNGSCPCSDAQFRAEFHGWCKHKLAVELFKEAQAEIELPELVRADIEELDRKVADLYW